MSRLILLSAIVAVVYLLLKSYRKPFSPEKAAPPENMLRCAHCGLYFPEVESVRTGEQVFCCAAHRDVHQKNRAS